MEKIYKIHEACRILRITNPTFYKLVKENKIETIKFGNRRGVTEESLKRFIAENSKKGM